MINYRNHTFFKDDEPIMILAGEIHYFRLDPLTWKSHLLTLKESGCNTVSTYVPWLMHQELEDKLDLDGVFNPRLNLPLFLKLASELGLFVFLRPGPFIMAELKNEGIPYWIYEKHPDAIPKTWNQAKVPTPTLDYLHKDFLFEVKGWFQSLYLKISPYLQQNGGPIIGIQLDNEVGMLSWVSNAPDLTDDIKHMMLEDSTAFSSFFSPSESEALRYEEMLGKSMRKRYRLYLSTLKDFWQNLGVKHMLYFINIHGTSHGRGKSFPIGISQLFESYQDQAFIPGTDIYLGNLDLENFHDLYLVNQMMLSTISYDQPMTSLEFNTSDGNFGDNLAIRVLPSAIDFKVRMSILQSHKMINYYLFTAGTNDRFKFLKDLDGNDRIAITGERHGFAAPVQVDGKRLYTFDRLKYITNLVNNLQNKLSLMHEETDPIAIGFHPNDYMTEYVYPDSEKMKSHKNNLSFHRETILWDLVTKHLLLLHYRFFVERLDVESIDPKKVPLLIYQTSKYMSKDLQLALIKYHQEGGKLLLVGELPIYDQYQNKLTLLIDYFDVSPLDTYYDWEHKCLSLTSEHLIKGAHEFRTFYAQTIKTHYEPVFNLYPSKEAVGFMTKHLIWVTAYYPGDVNLTSSWLEMLDATRYLKINHPKDAAIFSSVQKYQHQTLLHVMNLDHIDYQISITYKNQEICDGITLDLFAQDAYMIPIDLEFKNYKIIYSTAEIYEVKDDSLTIRLTQSKDVIKIKSSLNLEKSNDYHFTKDDDQYMIYSNHHAKVRKFITLTFN